MKQYIVDTFTDKVFRGNTAAVCVLGAWADDELMQNIAMENNYSETAFVVSEGGFYRIRWFTPKSEIDFCGHATLAASYVIANFIESNCTEIKYRTLSGDMSAKISDGLIEMNFPKYKLNKVAVTDKMAQAIGAKPVAAFLDRDLLLVLESEDAVVNLKPNQDAMKELDGLCVAVTARGKVYDCISRVFAPELNVPEDPVTGSTHCMIAPYWAEVLNKKEIKAYQASQRTGVLYASVEADRVKISGKAVLYGVSEILC